MWFRDENQPVKYTGIPFRSGLEASVAKELDDLSVEWAYERGVEDVEWYLPDFTILESIVDLELPTWVEVKPAELLYAVRDHVGAPERFTNDIKADITAKALHDAGLTEVWKPKLLAEHEGVPVLVVSKINRNRTLSIEMRPDGLVLSKQHPCVNWRQLLTDRQREQERRQWQLEAEERQRQRTVEDAQRRTQNLTWARSVNSRTARYDGWCIVCREQRPAGLLRIAQHDGRWLAFCTTHLT